MIGIRSVLDTITFGSGSITVVACKTAIEMVMTPPTVPPIAGPIRELKVMIRAGRFETTKLSEMFKDWQRMLIDVVCL